MVVLIQHLGLVQWALSGHMETVGRQPSLSPAPQVWEGGHMGVWETEEGEGKGKGKEVTWPGG